MQHFMVNDVLNCGSRHSRMVKYPAHYDHVMRWIVMAQAIAGHIAAPCYPGPRKQATEELEIQIVKNSFQIIYSPLREPDSFSSTEVPQQMGFLRNIMARYVSAVSSRVFSRNIFSIHFGQENMSNGLQHRFWRALQDVGEAHPQLALTQPNGVIHIGEWKKFNG